MIRVAVIGAGSWGTAIADLLARQGTATRLWSHEADVADAINRHHENPAFLPDAPLDPRLVASSDMRDVLEGATMVCAVTPSHVARTVLELAAPFIRDGVPLVSATKGIETESLALMHDVAREAVPQSPFVALSGPSFALEVLQSQPTAVVAASRHAESAQLTQAVFSTSAFRVYTLTDVVGVELAGSLKNVMAIAAGVLEGLGMGDNPRAALLTRGLAEITRLGEAMGANPATFAGLAGMGDLILTCTGALSRNRRLGMALAQGVSLSEYLTTNRTVAEGVNTALAASRLAARHGIEMPITNQVKAVLFDGISPADSVRTLMERTLKAETWG